MFIPHNKIEFSLEFEVSLYLAYFRENRREASRIILSLMYAGTKSATGCQLPMTPILLTSIVSRISAVTSRIALSKAA